MGQALQLSWVVRGGIGWVVRLGLSLTLSWILTLEPERSTGVATAGICDPQWLHWFGAQAACAFSLLGSKLSPFFQIVRAMAAILRASVSRAISGWMPATSRSW
jgi:hypothetical protein